MRDESYVIGLCDAVLGLRSRRQERFDFLRGDSGRQLPVDAYYRELHLVVEYHERQHSEAVPHFDNRMTISGVPRWEQRRIYDQRRREVLPKHGISLIVLSCTDLSHKTSRRLKRDRKRDLNVIKERLKRFAV